MTRDIAARFNHAYGCEVFKLPDPYILEDAGVVPGTDGRKMSKSYGNTIPMFATKKALKSAIMGIVTDSRPVAAPKDPTLPLFQLWNLFATVDERRHMEERAKAGGLGYGEVKKDLLARVLDHFRPMRERRAELAGQLEQVEAVLSDGVTRARAIAQPVLEAARAAAGLGRPSRSPA
jgi:tryptophanyl-tRNA synthetase